MLDTNIQQPAAAPNVYMYVYVSDVCARVENIIDKPLRCVIGVRRQDI